MRIVDSQQIEFFDLIQQIDAGQADEVGVDPEPAELEEHANRTRSERIQAGSPSVSWRIFSPRSSARSWGLTTRSSSG